VRDPASGDFVLRFLVPPAWPDGSYEASLALHHQDGHVETQQVAIRVDTTPAALAVLWSPSSAKPGEKVRLHLKPAIALPRLAQLASRDTEGGLAHALKGAIEVKEVLVRAPWGETVKARMEGPLGSYVADLTVPEGWREGAAELESVAADAAGNIARRVHVLEVGEGNRWLFGVLLALMGFGMAWSARVWRHGHSLSRE